MILDAAVQSNLPYDCNLAIFFFIQFIDWIKNVSGVCVGYWTCSHILHGRYVELVALIVLSYKQNEYLYIFYAI